MTRNVFWLVFTAALGIAAVAGCEAGAPGSGSRVGSSGVSADAPRLRLRLSGNLGGYLTPCGCASGQMGGLGRRAFRNKLDGRNIDLFLEGGNLIKHAGELEYAKLYTALEVLAQGEHNYKAIGLAALDLTIDQKDLAPVVASFPFVASDLMQADGKPWSYEGESVAPAFREEKLAHVTVRIGSLTMSLPKGANAKHYKIITPDEGWARAMKGAHESTYRIAMIHAEHEVIKKLKLRPKPDLIIAVNNDYVEPPPHADSADGIPLVHVGMKGRLLLDVTLVRGTNGPMLTRHEPVALRGSRTAKGAMRDKEALAVIRGHRMMVQADKMLERLAGKKPTASGASYVGAKACAECHDDDDEKCASHAHTRAWKTLVEAEKREKWPVTSYPECVSCHVVGYTYKSGFVSPEKTKDLLNVTCENCHGPGSIHVKSQGTDAEKPMPIAKPPVSSCTKCHNSEHSPKFDFKKYWKKTQHGG